MADITLINLNMLYIKFPDGRVSRQNHLALGPLYLVSALEAAGIEVDFRDYQMQEGDEIFSPEQLIAFLNNPAQIIGLSCMANLIPFVLYAIPFIKQAFPDRKIILGGVGTAFIEQAILMRIPEVDIIHRGEGEKNVPVLIDILKNNKSLSNAPGIFYRKNGNIAHNPPLKRIAELDNLPRPKYSLLDFSKYEGHNILGSRGCPYPCTFCSITPMWDWKAYSRSNNDIINEMVEMNQKFGVRQFLFQDEFFVSSPRRIIEFAEILQKRNLKLYYKAFARVDLVTKESMQAMADTGCLEIRFGIESGSDKILKRTKKGFTSEKAIEVVSCAKTIMRGVDAFYVWGFPFETMEDFSASIMQMITLRAQGVRILPSLLTYLPQTEIYRELENPDALEFCEYLLPEYMLVGIEKRLSVRVSIDKKYSSFVEYIKSNKDIFPGFFHMNVESNILPKLAMLEEFDFYKTQSEDSCGAHSPSKEPEELKLTLNI